MKNAFTRLWKKMNEPKAEKTLIILLPCLSVFIAALIVAPGLLSFMKNSVVTAPGAVTAAPQTAAAALSPSPAPSTVTVTAAPSPTVSPSPSPAPERKTVYMSASSTERDLYVKLTDASGNALTGQRLTLSFSYPGGEQYNFQTETDGTCYLVQLEPGDYTVTMAEDDIYLTPSPITCTVKDRVEYVQIEDIDEIVDVVDNTEISQSEIKAETGSVDEEIAPEYLSTPEDVYAGDGTVVQETPVLDESGNQTYTYSFQVGANGFLLLSDGITESDVIPMDENNDGTPEYGLQSGAGGVYTAVELYNPDNSPVSRFAVTAVPITETVSTLVGWQTIDGNTYYYNADGDKVTGLKSIDGRLYYFNEFGVRAQALGVDVSFYNEGVNWPAVKAQGIDFAIIRVGGRGWETGLLYDDACFRQNLSNALAAGLRVGVYFYTTAVDAVEAVQEASLVLDRLGGAALELPVYIDMEASGDYPNGRSDKLSKAQRTEIINAFCATIENSGYKPGVYSGRNFFRDELEYSFLTRYNIWLASYTSFNRVPDFNGRYDIWQFTDSGVVNGITGVCDMNAMFG